MAAIHGGHQTGQVRSSQRPMGLLMAPPAGGGEKGGLVEKPTHPKPAGGGSADPRQRRRAILAPYRQLEEDGNWADADVMEEMGLPQGTAAQIGGVVDMEDDVYLEFEEEEEVAPAPREPTSWKLLARYMANFKPHTKAMFTRLIEEVWHLRSGIEYSEKGKNYYMITLFSRGDYDFVKRGGPWIFNQNALIVTDLDESLQPSETALNAVPVWVRIYDVPWGKQNEVWGYRYGDGLGKTLEVDVPASEQQKKEFFRNVPMARRRSSMTPDYVPSQADSVDENNSMPPLMEDPLQDGVVLEEADVPMQAEVESTLVAQVYAMLVTAEMGE
ncbi:hypothetical protein ACQ4PT_038874 [Festuca glaucescens]